MVNLCWRSVRYAARTVRHNLRFAVIAISLALGAGANTAILASCPPRMLRINHLSEFRESCRDELPRMHRVDSERAVQEDLSQILNAHHQTSALSPRFHPSL